MNRLQPFDPGLTQKYTGELRRVINKDGSFNVHRKNVPFGSHNAYLFLVDTTWPKFILSVLAVFFIVNLIFAGTYCWVGIKTLVGADTNSGVGPFASAFFFSVHTLTTVGYGNVYPKGFTANTVAGFEAMVGLTMFALATGLLFARFSRPSARIHYSDRMLVAPYQGESSLQFRIANQRSNNLTDLEVRVVFMTVERCGDQLQRRYAELQLERNRVYFFPLTWTVVHPIDNSSPLFGLTASDLDRLHAEFVIVIKGFDETFSQTVNSRYSYRHDEVVWGAVFEPAFDVDRNGDLVLELDRINDRRSVPLPEKSEIPTAPTELPAG